MPFIKRAELLADGAVQNPHVYLGSGFIYCGRCLQYTYHDALTYPYPQSGLVYEVCLTCDTYTGGHEMRHPAKSREQLDVQAAQNKSNELTTPTESVWDSPKRKGTTNQYNTGTSRDEQLRIQRDLK